ncbi:hypothetical protein EPUS_08680 [Endocarpon pusillum Z07020]|uniref:Endonuclease/exonuclease/phosphatase domain-containing protein n=1 Tax=Endocarpon pusillum (strain Z07020 / HMAS-L-300199) TaxID=1263415 RepID=U1GX73_ENDPU|nr:uncharacterized protein EPUS_08680 [Endocarpon pusillum Z07020]ERF77113.1 hypothetical protein EPUS_08680 [Endocarpon pusillum Z07020]
MSSISAHLLSRSASGRPLGFTRLSSFISSISHLTDAESQLYFEHLDAKSRLRAQQPPCRISQGRPAPRFLRPQIHDPRSSSWVALEKTKVQEGLGRGKLLKVVSGNIECFGPGPAARASAALGHLTGLFGEEPGPLVVMLQEVQRESLQAIMDNSWVQRNFVLSNVEPPESIYTDTAGDSFVLRDIEWGAHPYFTLMMTPRHLAITSCFRVPFVTKMGRDALVVDIPVFSPGRCTQLKESFRLCTTHLESLWEGRVYRPGQLALISALLKGAPATESKITAGLNTSSTSVWEDVPAPPIPVFKPFQKDLSYGQARGNTWSHQSKSSRERKRMDKFFYTGSLETVAIHEAQDITGRLGRLGISLKTEVEAWEFEYKRFKKSSLRRGKYVEEPHKIYFSESAVAKFRDEEQLVRRELVHTKINAWVSDHFGIAVGIKVL